MNQLEGKIKEAEYVLVGIGMDFKLEHTKQEQLKAYNSLRRMIGERSFFVVTLNPDDLIFESDFEEENIVSPCGSERAGNVVTDENYDESWYLPKWQVYTKWLTNTLNRKLCILELGAGFQYPSVIRWPFEKTAYFNQKSFLIRVHNKLAQLTPETKERGISLSQDPISYILE